MSLITDPRCELCDDPATCFGQYDGMPAPALHCDACCGHACEDGHCDPIAAATTCPNWPRQPSPSAKIVLTQQELWDLLLSPEYRAQVLADLRAAGRRPPGGSMAPQGAAQDAAGAGSSLGPGACPICYPHPKPARRKPAPLRKEGSRRVSLAGCFWPL